MEGRVLRREIIPQFQHYLMEEEKSDATVSILLAVILMLSLSVTAFADDASVTYEGGAEKFVFLPDSDLFSSFKGVMPGDTVTEEIVVKNNLSGNYTVRIYLKAVPHDEKNPLQPEVAASESIASMSDFLSQLSMTVKQGSKVLFNAAPSELGGLSDWVLLGNFAKGSKTTLTVELSVPIELGNEYADRVGEVDWVFMAEQIPNYDPQTGDDSNIALYAVLCGLSVIAMGAALAVLSKKKI